MTAKTTFVVRSSLVSAHTHGKIMRETLREEMEHHRDTRLQSHFEPGANRRYHYRNRRQRYIRWKLKKTGQNVDWVLTGQSKEDAKRVRPTATQYVSKYHLRLRFPIRDENRKELETVLVYEQREVAAGIRERYYKKAGLPVNQLKRTARSR